MPPIRSDQLLTPSVLDRLLDNEPDTNVEAPKPRAQAWREQVAAVRRDLEALLNTRRYCLALPAGLDELKQSVVTYGLPDTSSVGMATADAREAFRRTVEQTVRLFEPRFRNVRVKLVDDQERLDRTLRFRIEALLRAEPAPEQVAFDSQLDPGSGAFAVKSAEL